MNYYHLTTHPLAQRISTFLDEQAAAKKLWIDFSKKVGAINLCGWNFFFEGDKKPNKHWIKSKKQKWDETAYTPSKKTEEGKKLVEELKFLHRKVVLEQSKICSSGTIAKETTNAT